MRQNFEKHIATVFPNVKGKKILIACSGGVDSMALSKLLLLLGFDIALAHCNFKIRGEESDEDEVFVTKTAKDWGIPCYTKQFDTTSYAELEKLSIQMAARELRYQWFEELLQEKGYDYLATGHHADDDLETFFINLSRGTGLRGLTGIPRENTKLIRPLLAFSRNEILAFAKENELYWREDSSNQDTKYLRNQLRHTLIPSFKELGENALKGFYSSQKYLKQGQELIDDYIQLIYNLVVSEDDEGIVINIKKIKDLPNTGALLYELLRPFGFTDFDAIENLLDAQTGKQIVSKSYRIIKNRELLLISRISDNIKGIEFQIESGELELKEPVSLQFSEAERFQITNALTIFVDTDKLIFPLIIRKMKEGDVFHPFGMKGKKKLSKFFKDEKLSLVAKENSWLLCSGDQIVWVIGYRMDDRFKVTKETKKIVRIDYTPN